MAVRWMVKAWEEVPAEVITNCFKHVGMTADEEMSMEMDDDPFTGEEFATFDDDVAAYEPPVDTTLPNWRENMRKEIIEASEEDNEMNDEETIEEFDQPLAVPEVNSVQGAMQLFKKLKDYSDWHGNEKLSQAIAHANDILLDMQLKSMKQLSIHKYFVRCTCMA